MRYLTGYLFLFLLGSAAGWIIELFFRRFFSPAKKWINPGFLTGPYLPLYGFGVCILFFISDLQIDWWWKIILFCVLLTLIEYIAGILFIKGMKIKLWDYSDRKMNLQGIICPLFSLFWTALGTFFLFVAYPGCKILFDWVGTARYFYFVMGLIYGVLVVDIGMTFHLSAKIRSAAKRAKEVVTYERLKSYIASNSMEKMQKRSFIFAFRSKRSIKENVEEYIAGLREKRQKKDGDDEKKSKR